MGIFSRLSRKRRTKKASARTPKRRQLALEPLEERLAPVVNAAASFPQTINPGAGFDGVVRVLSPSGSGTGTLLWTGHHILTAAHIVDLNGDGVADAGTHRIQFDMPGGSVVINVPAANITVHNQWNGLINQGSDIAIVRLPSVAPFGAEGREIYEGTQEAMQVISFLGYGATNRTDAAGNVLNGNNGQSNNPPAQATAFGTKRIGFNRVDSVLRLPSNSADPTDDYLRFDLDNPSSTTDPGVNGEALAAQGDSGGPLLIADLIAGVASSATVVTAFGAIADYVRVSSFAGWIDQTIGARYSLVLDMNNQLAGNNGSPDTIELRSENQFVQIIVNGQVYYSGLATEIRDITIRGSVDADTITIRTAVGPLTVDGDGGADIINIEALPRGITATINGGFSSDQINFSPTLGDLNNIQGTVTVDGGPAGGNDNLVFNDWGNGSRNRSYTLRTDSLATPGRLATIAYARVGNVFLAASPAPDATVNVYGTAAGTSTIVSGAAVVNIGAPELFIRIPGKHTRDIDGALSIFNLVRSTALTIDDSSTGGISRMATLTQSNVYGLSDEPIFFGFARLSSLTVNGGSAGNTFTVQDTRTREFIGPITLNTGNGNDTVNVQQIRSAITVNGQRGADIVNVGLNGSMQAITAQLTVTNAGNWSMLNLDDSADTLPRTVSMDVAGNAGTITGLAPGRIRYRKQDIRSLNVMAGNGGNRFDIRNTNVTTFPDGTMTTVQTGNGNDVVSVYGTTGPLTIDGQANWNQVTIGSPRGHRGTLNSILGAITLRGQQGALNDLVITDSASTGQYTYTMTAGQFTRFDHATGLTTAPIDYSALEGLQNLEIFGGMGSNRFLIVGTPNVPGPTGAGIYLSTGPQDDFVTVFGTDGPMNVVFGSGFYQSIAIGDATHSLDAVRGPIRVSGSGFIEAFISDEASITAHDALIDYDANGVFVEWRGIHGSGVTLNTFRFAFADQGRINYRAGQAVGGPYNQIDVLGVPANTSVLVAGGPGYDLFTVGSDGRRILGPVSIRSPQADIDFAYFSDYLNPNPQAYTVRTSPFSSDTALVERPGLPAVSFGGLTQLIFFAPLVGGNTIDVQSVPANLFLNMVVGHGDTVTLGRSNDPDRGGTLAGIQGPVSVSSFSENDAVNLTLDDSGNTDLTTKNVALAPRQNEFDYGNHIIGFAPGEVFWRLGATSTVALRGGAASEVFVAQSSTFPATISIGGGGGNNLLQGPNVAANNWSILSANAGVLNTGIRFSNIQNLYGSINFDDTFVFRDGAGLAGTIDGFFGVNTLDYSAYTTGVTVNLPLGKATGTGLIARIQKVVGSSGNDILVGNGGNVLEGRGGRDLLIAGTSASTLLGGAGEDLLIGGYLLDNSQANLDAIMAEWARTGTGSDYHSRVAALRAGLLAGGKVLGNGGGNTLSGGPDALDLFFGSIDRDALDNAADEMVVVI